MQIINKEDHFHKCGNCLREKERGALFPGIEVVIDGMMFRQSYFLCSRCLKEAVGYLEEQTLTPESDIPPTD